MAAKSYEEGSKATTAKPTATLLEKLNSRLSFREASGILDNGSGPGPYMSRLIETYAADIHPSCTLICADWAPTMIEQVNNAKANAVSQDSNSLWSRVDARVLDAIDLSSIGDESLSHVMAGWVSSIDSCSPIWGAAG